MISRVFRDVLLLGTLAGVTIAAPATEVRSAAKPVTMTLSKHVLAGGAKPRNRARLSRKLHTGQNVERASSEPLSDYYLGTDLQ